MQDKNKKELAVIRTNQQAFVSFMGPDIAMADTHDVFFAYGKRDGKNYVFGNGGYNEPGFWVISQGDDTYTPEPENFNHLEVMHFGMWDSQTDTFYDIQGRIIEKYYPLDNDGNRVDHERELQEAKFMNMAMYYIEDAVITGEIEITPTAGAISAYLQWHDMPSMWDTLNGERIRLKFRKRNLTTEPYITITHGKGNIVTNGLYHWYEIHPDDTIVTLSILGVNRFDQTHFITKTHTMRIVSDMASDPYFDHEYFEVYRKHNSLMLEASEEGHPVYVTFEFFNPEVPERVYEKSAFAGIRNEVSKEVITVKNKKDWEFRIKMFAVKGLLENEYKWKYFMNPGEDARFIIHDNLQDPPAPDPDPPAPDPDPPAPDPDPEPAIEITPIDEGEFGAILYEDDYVGIARSGDQLYVINKTNVRISASIKHSRGYAWAGSVKANETRPLRYYTYWGKELEFKYTIKENNHIYTGNVSVE